MKKWHKKFIKDVTLTKDTIELNKVYLGYAPLHDSLAKIVITKLEKNRVEAQLIQLPEAWGMRFYGVHEPATLEFDFWKIRKGEIYRKTAWRDAVWQIAEMTTLENYR